MENREVEFSSQHKEQDKHLEEGIDQLAQQQRRRGGEEEEGVRSGNKREVKFSFQLKHLEEGGQQYHRGEEEGGRPLEDEGGDCEGSERGGAFYFHFFELLKKIFLKDLGIKTIDKYWTTLYDFRKVLNLILEILTGNFGTQKSSILFKSHFSLHVFKDIVINTDYFDQVLRAKNEIMASIRAALVEKS